MTTNDGVTAFLYLLLVDYLPVGAVEDLIRRLVDLENTADGYDLSNEHLARCAHELAYQITRVEQHAADAGAEHASDDPYYYKDR